MTTSSPETTETSKVEAPTEVLTAQVVTPATFKGSRYDRPGLRDLLSKSLSVISDTPNKGDRHGILAFVQNLDDINDLPVCVVNCPTDELGKTPEVTDVLSAYRAYLLRCTKPKSSITVPSTPEEMLREIWLAFAATTVVCTQKGGDVRTIPLQNLTDILVRAYGYPDSAAYPVLLCLITYSKINNTVKVRDITGMQFSDLIPVVTDESVLNG